MLIRGQVSAPVVQAARQSGEVLVPRPFGKLRFFSLPPLFTNWSQPTDPVQGDFAPFTVNLPMRLTKTQLPKLYVEGSIPFARSNLAI